MSPRDAVRGLAAASGGLLNIIYEGWTVLACAWLRADTALYLQGGDDVLTIRLVRYDAGLEPETIALVTVGLEARVELTPQEDTDD